jgi:hypothetical protein
MKDYIVHTIAHCIQYVKAKNEKEAKKKVNSHSAPHVEIVKIEETT